MHISVDKARLYRDVEKLCSVDPPRNYRNIDSLNHIADYIQKSFEEMGLVAMKQSYLANNEIYHNICASVAVEKPERIVIGAHYDVDGDQPGADDNASAVAGLLEIARLVSANKPDLKHRVDFVAFTLEEAPFFYTDSMGSAIHAKSLKEAEAKVKAMICLEMIGYFSDAPNSQQFPLEAMKLQYPSVGNFIAVVGKSGEESLVNEMKKWMVQSSAIDVQSLCAPVELLNDITRSDHFNYWKEGYPAVMITDTSFLRNPNYHQASDQIDTLNFDKMVEVVKGVYQALIKL